MSQLFTSILSISALAKEKLSDYAMTKKRNNTVLRLSLQPFIDALNVKDKHDLDCYKRSIKDALAAILLEDEIFKVIGRTAKTTTTGETELTEKEIYFHSLGTSLLNDFEMAIRVSAQKKMGKEYAKLRVLWFNYVSTFNLQSALHCFKQ